MPLLPQNGQLVLASATLVRSLWIILTARTTPFLYRMTIGSINFMYIVVFGAVTTLLVAGKRLLDDDETASFHPLQEKLLSGSHRESRVNSTESRMSSTNNVP